METLQGIFYALASVYLLLGIFFFAFLIFVVWKAYQAAVQAQKNINEFKENIGGKVVEFAAKRPVQVAQILGTGLASYFYKKVREIFREKTSSE